VFGDDLGVVHESVDDGPGHDVRPSRRWSL
jgi:hypothetical protein